MKKILTILFVFVAANCFAQTKTLLPPTGSSNTISKFPAASSDSVQYLPSKSVNMLPYMAAKRGSATYVDTVNNIPYWYSPSTNTWYTITGGGGDTLTYQPLVIDETLGGGIYTPASPKNIGADTINYIATKSDLSTITNTDSGSITYIVNDTASAPRGGEADGTKYLVTNTPTGTFASRANQIATLTGGVWNYQIPVSQQQVIIDNPSNYFIEVYQGTYPTGTWKQISILWRVGGNNNLGTNSWIGRVDNKPFLIRVHNHQIAKFDIDSSLIMPKYAADSSLIYATWDLNGKFVKGHFTPAIIYVDSVSNNVTNDSSVVFKNGVRRAYPLSAGGSGSTDYVKSGTGIRVDSTGRNYTVNNDTIFMSTRAWRQKGIDSVQANVNLKLNITDTAAINAEIVQLRNGKQNNLILTTTGTSGAATLIGATLNIPQYPGGGGGGGGSKDTVNVANVLSYGADSTGATDATAAINAAINNTLGKNRIYFPHGRYKVTVSHVAGADSTNKKGIIPLSNQELFGDGDATIITIDTTSAFVTFTHPGNVTNGVFYPIFSLKYGQSNVRIHDLAINGNLLKQANFGGNSYHNVSGHGKQIAGIFTEYGSNNQFYNLKIDSCQHQAITDNSSYTIIKNVRATTSGNGGIGFGAGSFNSILENSLITNNYSDNVIFSSNAEGTTVQNNEISWAKFVGAGGGGSFNFDGVYINSSDNIKLINNKIHDNSSFGVELAVTKKSTLEKNTISYNGAASGVVLRGSTIFSNNTLVSNGKLTNGAFDTLYNNNPTTTYAIASQYDTSYPMVVSNNIAYDTGTLQKKFISSYINGTMTGNFIYTPTATSYYQAYGRQFYASSSANGIKSSTEDYTPNLTLDNWQLAEVVGSGTDTFRLRTTANYTVNPISFTGDNILMGREKSSLSQSGLTTSDGYAQLTTLASLVAGHPTALELGNVGSSNDGGSVGAMIRLRGTSHGNNLYLVSRNNENRQLILSAYEGSGGSAQPLVLGTSTSYWWNGYKTQITMFPSGNTAITNSTTIPTDKAGVTFNVIGNAQATAGFNIMKNATLSAQTTSGTVVTYTTGAADSTFEVGGSLTVTSVTGGTVLLQVTWKDESNTTRTKSFYSQGTTTDALSTTDVSSFPPMTIRCKASNTITIATVATSTITFNAEAYIRRVIN